MLLGVLSMSLSSSNWRWRLSNPQRRSCSDADSAFFHICWTEKKWKCRSSEVYNHSNGFKENSPDWKGETTVYKMSVRVNPRVSAGLCIAETSVQKQRGNHYIINIQYPVQLWRFQDNHCSLIETKYRHETWANSKVIFRRTYAMWDRQQFVLWRQEPVRLLQHSHVDKSHMTADCRLLCVYCICKAYRTIHFKMHFHFSLLHIPFAELSWKSPYR